MKPKIAIVISRFNETITKKLHDEAITRLTELGFSTEDFIVRWVPGAVEIPLVAQHYAVNFEVDAVICLGAVIRGETDHYDYVCQQVSYGCQKVALETGIPILFGVLTTETEAQALARANGEHSSKGRYCVDAALEMIGLLNEGVWGESDRTLFTQNALA